MIKQLTYESDCLHVHAEDTSLKTTKSFTHGGILFDLGARTAVFGTLPAAQIPDSLVLEEGATLKLQLVAPDGTLRSQVRSGQLKGNEKQPGLLRIGGTAQTARRFSAEDGWGNAVYKYRAYFRHTGLKTDEQVPEWLKESIQRQKQFWNRLAWLCREARRQCSPVSSEQVIAFVQETILPAIDQFNDSLGVSKQKMKHPEKLKVEEPGVDQLWKFVGELRGRIEKGRRVPDGLLEKVVAFAEQFKADYTPLNKFLNQFSAIAEKEAADLHLRRFEIRPIVTAFKAALDRRRTTKNGWSEGWPMIKYNDHPKSSDWGLHYYFNKAGVESERLETAEGVPGLTFGPPTAPLDTAHPLMDGVRGGKVLREAQISIAGDNGQRWEFRFAVMMHRSLPPGSHVKEWKLIFNSETGGGQLWLCLTLELQRPVPEPKFLVAGLDIGWRRKEEGIRFGTLYEPATWTMRELMLDLQRSPKDFKDREPFRIDMGPTHWDKRNLCLIFLKGKPGEEVRYAQAPEKMRQVAALFPEWKPGGQIPGALGIKEAFQTRRDYIKDEVKIKLRNHLGDAAPVWLDRAGSHGLLALGVEFKEDAVVQELLAQWSEGDRALGNLTKMYVTRLTKRIEHGQQVMACDICRYLKKKGITRLAIETSFLAKVAQKHDNEDPVSLKRSQRYRQFAAPGKFVDFLKNAAANEGILIEAHSGINTTRICRYCDHLNPATELDSYQCEGCHRVIRQDENAAVNLSRFATYPELAAMAVNAKSEASSESDAEEEAV